MVEPHVRAYEKLILRDKAVPGLTIQEAITIYKNFHLLRKATGWGEVQVSCNCPGEFANCVCKDTLSLRVLVQAGAVRPTGVYCNYRFSPVDVQVQEGYID
jgi:hypothetical protein